MYYEMHAYDVYGYEIHASDIHAHETPTLLLAPTLSAGECKMASLLVF
jgi:hypothetical protein